jgi:predicted dithiol-disulfide oxidoreductase (DUF899 family)
MLTETIPHPETVSQQEWLAARKALLKKEKELTQMLDAVNAERRRLPMVKIEKDYVFDTSTDKQSLRDLFGDCHQLVIYHFMFDPEWDKGCMGCTGYVDALGDLSMLNERNTAFAIVSRAPQPKLETYKASRGWDIPWYSSFESDFNYDYQVTLDEKVAPVEYNYLDDAATIAKKGSGIMRGENPGMSVFFRVGDDVYHTYSAYARGVEGVTDAYAILDITPYGRQEDWEDSPPGWPQKPTYG